MRVIDKITHCNVELGDSISLTLYYDKVSWLSCEQHIKVYEDGILVFEIHNDEIILFNQLSPTYSCDIKVKTKDLDEFSDFIMEEFEEFCFSKPIRDQNEIDKILN